MAGCFDGEELRAGRNQREGCGHLFERAGGIAASLDKESGRAEFGEVLGAELVRFARRMERIGEQEQRLGQAWLCCGKDRGLAASIGVASQKNTLCAVAAYRFHGRAEACLIPGCGVQGRSVGTLLAEGEIATEHGDTRGSEGLGQRGEEGSLAIGSGSVGEDEGGVGRGRVRSGFVEEAADRRVGGGGKCAHKGRV